MHTARVAPERTDKPARLAAVLCVAGGKGGFMNYWDQLKDPRWQKKRLERLSAEGWQCMNCCDKTETLHVHHKRYVNGRAPWEYEDVELDVLCDGCHKYAHIIKSQLDILMANASSLTEETTIGLMSGYAVAGEMIDESVAQALTVERKGDYELGIAAWCLEAMGHSVIRQLISEFVRRRPGFPAIERIVASWSDEETEPDSAA